MSDTRRFTASLGDILVEVANTGAPEPNAADLQTLLAPIAVIAQSVGSSLAGMAKDGAPSHAQVVFGIKALEQNGIAVALGDPANFNVTLTWGGGEDSEIAGIAALIPKS